MLARFFVLKSLCCVLNTWPLPTLNYHPRKAQPGLIIWEGNSWLVPFRAKVHTFKATRAKMYSRNVQKTRHRVTTHTNTLKHTYLHFWGRHTERTTQEGPVSLKIMKFQCSSVQHSRPRQRRVDAGPPWSQTSRQATVMWTVTKNNCGSKH